MTTVEEKEVNAIQLTENYRVISIPRNIVLQEKYETSLGKGRYAEKSGEFSYKDIGYYSNFKAVTNAIINKELINAIDTVKELNQLCDYIDKIKEEICSHINEYITVDLVDGNKKPTKKIIRGMEISESE